MTAKVAIHTLGCRANQYDSDSLQAKLTAMGFSIVGFEEAADCYLVNTCTVTADADRTARHLIRKVHRQNPDAKIIVTGCYAQMAPSEIAKIEGVTDVVGNSRKEEVLDLIVLSLNGKNGASEDGEKSVSEAILTSGISQPKLPRVEPPILGRPKIEGRLFEPSERKPFLRSRAHIKIQDGCNFRCSFCIVPFARGKSQSRPAEEIIAEMQTLNEYGFHEVVLTGIHIGGYGRDLSPKTDLYSLMRLIEKHRPVERVRLSTLDPDEISNEMIDLMASSDIFCPHLHIAIQSGEDAILKKMRRRHTTRELTKTADYACKKIADLGLGADIISGFPGETDKEHRTTKKLLEGLPLTYLHVFPYSERKGTAAATYDGSVPVPIRKERALELIALGTRKKEKFWRGQIGKIRRFIAEEGGGTTDNYIPLWRVGAELPKGVCGLVLLENIKKGRMTGKWISQPMKRSA